MSDETNAESLRKSATILFAFITLALGLAGAFFSWRDSVHDRIGALSESIMVMKAEANSDSDIAITLLKKIEKLELKIDKLQDESTNVKERLIRCEKS
jgi:hypothetical protein